MFIPIKEKKSSPAFFVAMAKNFENTLEEHREYERLYDYGVVGIYGAWRNNPEELLNRLRYDVAPSLYGDLLIKLPKSKYKREMRQYHRKGVKALSDPFYRKHIGNMIRENTSFSLDERNQILKHIAQYYCVDNCGICDHPAQIKEYFKFLENSDKKYIALVNPIYQKNEKERCFRYRKAGRYIGKQDLRNEYLYDDTHIEKIYLFSIFEIKEKGEPDFGGHQFKIVGSDVYNKDENVVATYLNTPKFGHKFVVGYTEDDKTLQIPDSIKDHEALLCFLDENATFLD